MQTKGVSATLNDHEFDQQRTDALIERLYKPENPVRTKGVSATLNDQRTPNKYKRAKAMPWLYENRHFYRLPHQLFGAVGATKVINTLCVFA